MRSKIVTCRFRFLVEKQVKHNSDLGNVFLKTVTSISS